MVYQIITRCCSCLINLPLKLILAIWRLIKWLLPLHSAAWDALAEPIASFLNASNPAKDQQTKVWKENMQFQLNVIAVTGTVVSGVVTTALGWPALSTPDGYTGTASGFSSWPVRALWNTSLILAITSLCAATQQAVVLHRLSCYPDGLRRIQDLLGRQVAIAHPPQIEPRNIQLYIWQTPAMLLNGSVYCFAGGLFCLFFDAARLKGLAWDSRDTKILAVSTIATVFCITNYLVASTALYWRIRNL